MPGKCPVCGSDVRIDSWEGGSVRVETCGHHYKAVFDINNKKDRMDGVQNDEK